MPHWVEIAEKNPQSLRQEIAQATLDDLNELARLVLEKRRPEINAHVREAIDGRRRELEQTRKIDTRLEMLESRLYLARLLEIRAPAKEEPSTLDGVVAGPLRWIGEKTKDWWGIKGFSEGLRNLKGRDLERSFYNLLAFFGRMGQAIPGVSFLPIGLVLKFGDRKVAEMDIQDTINEKRFAGETIAFAGIPSAEWDRWSAANAERARTGQPVPLLPDLTKTYIDSLRRENYLQGKLTDPLNLTFTGIVDQKGRETVVKSLEDDRKKQEAIAAWKPAHVTDIKAGTPPAAVRSGAGWTVTVPEADMTAKGPYSPQATLLRDAMRELAEAKEITVVAETERCEIDFNRMSIRLPAKTDIPPMADFNYIMMQKGNRRLKKLVFANPEEMPLTNNVRAQFLAGGTLMVSDHASRVQALKQLNGSLLDGAEFGQKFEYKNGTWTLVVEPMPIRTP